MYIVSTILILNIVGFLGAWKPDIDINRIGLPRFMGCVGQDVMKITDRALSGGTKEPFHNATKGMLVLSNGEGKHRKETHGLVSSARIDVVFPVDNADYDDWMVYRQGKPNLSKNVAGTTASSSTGYGVRLIKNEDAHYRPRNTHSRRSIFTHKFRNDNDHNSSGFSKLWPPLQPVSDPSSAEPKALKVHKPREDPRLFYQSDTYAKEVLGNSLNNEVTAIYPGRDVVRAGEQYYRKSYPARLRERGTNMPHDEICVTCPHDRTIIAKPGSDRVRLPHPRLTSCRGYQVSRDVKFIPMYGPKFGSLLQKGSHVILGQIKHKNKMLRYCYMTVHVLIQTCALPKYLIADCGDENKTCSFECRDPKAELRGSSALTCGDDMRWLGQLPICSAQSWCEPVSPPDHGRISCKGETVDGWGLADGAVCRIKCAKSWKSNTKLAVCRRGVWSQNFTCTAIIQDFL